MSWTWKAFFGLVAIFALWCAGWVILILLLLTLERNWPASLPHSQGMQVVSMLAPGITYFFAGPAACVFFIRWIRKQSGKEHEKRTRERIAQQRIAKQLER